MAMTPWQVTTNRKEQRRLGKTGEELGELMAVVGRIGIQGIDEIDPSSGATNKDRLYDEIADVLAQIKLLFDFYKLDANRISARQTAKIESMHEWDRLVEPDDTDC